MIIFPTHYLKVSDSIFIPIKLKIWKFSMVLHWNRLKSEWNSYISDGINVWLPKYKIIEPGTLWPRDPKNWNTNHEHWLVEMKEEIILSKDVFSLLNLCFEATTRSYLLSFQPKIKFEKFETRKRWNSLPVDVIIHLRPTYVSIDSWLSELNTDNDNT